MTAIAGWGRYPKHETRLVTPPTPKALPSLLAEHSGLVARGNGRAYGDAAIGERTTLSSRSLNRMRAFDPSTGRLTVEAGVMLSDILATFVPRGFFPPVVPGTKLVTVGGMIAADVHGKNHHRDGGFGDQVESFRLVLPSGETVTCSAAENPALFAATIGGMGLTGTIAEATFRLRPIETGWIRQRTVAAADLDGAMAALEEASGTTYSVAWIDCLKRGAALGRSLVFTGEHATVAELAAGRPKAELFPGPMLGRLSVPIDFPVWTLNRASVTAFNELYYRLGASKLDPFLVHWDPYFFPLDGIRDWNRIYGRGGFLQYQCVVPTPAARRVLGEIIDRIARHGDASFLAVLKQLGSSSGTIAFPLPGYTLTLDLHVTPEIFAILDELDQIVVEAGGRLYLAKDARQSRATFEAGHPGLGQFQDIRRDIGAGGRIASQLSNRLGI